MKKYAVSYFKNTGNAPDIVVLRETIRALNKEQARDIAKQHKPADADNYNIRDITGTY